MTELTTTRPDFPTAVPQDSARVRFVADLRALADLLESVPELPYYDYGVTFALGGTRQEAFDRIERAADALREAGIRFEYRDTEHYRSLDFTVGDLRYGFCKMTDQAMADDAARRSYHDAVRVDDTVRDGGA